MNRVLKDGIKAALAEGKSFKEGVRQTLAAYRTMAHNTTGVSPASLMLAFPVRTPLSILKPNGSISTPATSTVAFEKRVRFQQQRAAKAHDRRTRATPPSLHAGDWVRIRLPRRSHKLAPMYSEPFEVARVNGNCVVLRNGQRWNLRRCLHHRTIMRNPSTNREQSSTQHSPPPAASPGPGPSGPYPPSFG